MRHQVAVDVSATLKPGSEYLPSYTSIAFVPILTGGRFNYFDVELLVYYSIDIIVNYPLAADNSDFMEGREDIIATKEPILAPTFWDLLALLWEDLWNNLLDLLGIDGDLLMYIIIGVVALVGLYIASKIFGGFSGRR